MRKGLLVLCLVTCWGLYTCKAEAGIGDWVKNSFEYVVAPVNCLAQLGRDLIGVGVKFTVCIIANANRNPATLTPLITIP